MAAEWIRESSNLILYIPKLPTPLDSFPPKTGRKKMATLFLSTAKTFLPILLSSPPPSIHDHKHNTRPQLTQCKAVSDSPPPYPPILTKRSLSLSLTSTFLFSIAGQLGHFAANAAILEADDDEELLERVKKDRKKRLERQGVISSSNKERGWFLSHGKCIF